MAGSLATAATTDYGRKSGDSRYDRLLLEQPQRLEGWMVADEAIPVIEQPLFMFGGGGEVDGASTWMGVAEGIAALIVTQ